MMTSVTIVRLLFSIHSKFYVVGDFVGIIGFVCGKNRFKPVD